MNRYQKQQAQYGAKKHVTQMTEVEKEFLMRQFRSVNKKDWKFTPYSKKRFDSRVVSVEQLLSIFDLDTELVEFHRKDGSSRILLRAKRVFNDAQVCVVFAPKQETIITMYLNYHGNQHENLREEFYNAGLDVIQMYKGGRSK